MTYAAADSKSGAALRSAVAQVLTESGALALVESPPATIVRAALAADGPPLHALTIDSRAPLQFSLAPDGGEQDEERDREAELDKACSVSLNSGLFSPLPCLGELVLSLDTEASETSGMSVCDCDSVHFITRFMGCQLITLLSLLLLV